MKMTSMAPMVEQRKSRFVAGFLWGALLLALIVGTAVWVSTGIGLLRLMGIARGGTTVINVNQPTVVRQIQQLQRLETVNYTMDKIISGEHANAYLPKFLAGDRLLLVMHGEVIGGIDLGKVKSADVSVRGQTIAMRIPKAEVFTTRIDNARTRVYSRDTGLFSSPDPNLESQVREEAERQLRQAALQDGLLKTAEENARGTLASMLKGLGFKQVEIGSE
ncbi:MAG TPA: DUF4230 domain-containing protein [Candidatus Eisenbacteria bacterium]|jgi:hypothetical protein|nr:DUF4230 domain-containing protein [Candidatus Eisenbacteria bacterium]